MATLIQSKQIQGVVTASVIEGDFSVQGNIIATGSNSIFGDITASAISSSGPIYGVRYDDVQGTPDFVGGSGIVITQVGDTITITNTGGGGGVSGSAELISSVAQLNAYTGSNDIIILGLQSQINQLISQTGSYETKGSGIISGSDQLTSSLDSRYALSGSSGGGVSSWNELTDIPSGLVSGSVLRTLDGTGVLSGSVLTDLSSSIASTIDSMVHTQIPQGTISSSQQISDLGFVTSSGASGEHTDISHLNQFTSSVQTEIDGLSAQTSSYLTELPSGLISGSSQINLVVGCKDPNALNYNVNADINDVTLCVYHGSNQWIVDNLPSGLVSSSDQVLGGSGILSGSHTDITSLNQFTSSVQTEIDGLSSLTSSYLTELPSDLVSGSVLRTLDGTDVLSGSILPGTGITIDSSSGDYVITSIGSDGDTSFDGNREVTNTLLGDLFTDSYNAGTSGSIQDFLNEMFFPSYAPTATFTTQTSNLNTNLTADGTVIETISISDTVDDSPYVVTISGDSSDAFRVVPTNADSSSWEIQSVDNLTAGTFTYDITVSDKNSASRTYSGRSVEILQANAGTLSTTGTLYIIESATTGPIYLGSNGRGGSQGGVSVSYSPNYGTQSARNFTSSNPLISINSSTGVLSVGDPIKGSGNLSGSTITTTIGWNDQYGNSGTSDITVNVTQNNAPDIQFSNSSRLNTNQAVNGGGTLVTISFSDTEGDSINHDSFQFTDTSGQLTATKSGNNYLVTADSNLSGSTSYTIGTTIEDVHGFRSNTESHTFTIVQSGNGTISGDTTIYIVESALNGDSFRDATGFGAGNTADVNVSYSPSAGGQSVQSFSSSNPSILINSSGNMTLGVDLSGSTTQSGDTIETLITFQDQYGNIGSGSVTANVFGNLAPSVSFIATSDYNTDNALANSNAGVITISDTETNSPYNVTLSGTNGDSFNVVPQNAASSSWQVQPKSSLSLGTYSIDITVTDNYGEVSTLSNKSIVVSSATDYGVVYVYTSTFGSDAGFGANYLGVMGASAVNSDTPPEVTTYSPNTLSPFFTLKGGSIGDSSITLASSTSMTLRDTISGDVTLDSALQNNGSIIASGTSQVILVYPSGSDMEVPTSIQQSINGVSGGGVPYMNVDSAGWGIQSAQIHSIILDTPHLGYTEWFVLGRQSRDGIGSSFEYRIVNANGGSAPS